MLIDRTRRGTHDRADVTEPCRGCATAVSCRAASRTSRRAGPLPSPAVHTAHRWRKLEEPRDVWLASATAVAHDVPLPCGQRRRRTYPDNSYRLQADAIRGPTSLGSQRSPWDACTGQRRRRSRRKPTAASGTRPSRMHDIRSTSLAGSPAVANRPAEAARCLESRASPRTRVYHPQYARCGENLRRTQQAHTNTRPMPA